MPAIHATDYLKDPAANPPAAMTVLYGAERHLKREVFEALRKSVLGSEDDDDISLTRFSGNDVELKTVADELRTVSMWGDTRLVAVDDDDDAFVKKFRSGLESYLKSPAKKSVLVLLVKSWAKTTRLAKDVAKSGLAIECAELKGAALFRWLADACETEFGKQISRDACALVVEMAGAELGLLNQELAKLAAYVGDRPRIAPDDVRAVVGGWTTQTAFQMIDALVDGRLDRSLTLLDELLRAGESPHRILGAITFSFRKIAVATDAAAHGTKLGAALVETGIFRNRVGNSENYLRRIGYREATATYKRLLKTDGELKGGARVSERVALERLLVQLSGRLRAGKSKSR